MRLRIVGRSLSVSIQPITGRQMNLRAALADGRLGLTLDLPDTFELVADEPDAIHVIRREDGTDWRLLYRAGLPFDLATEHRPQLLTELRMHARAMFDDIAATLDARVTDDDLPVPAELPDDFDPLIEVHDVTVDGAPGLAFSHRMALRPGREIVMGHLLIPLADGLFEARAIAQDQHTGMRESVLLMTRLEETNALATLSRAEIDDPAHDALFPQHCLSRVRTGLRWFADAANIAVARPAAPILRTPIDDRELGCRFVPAPRFAPTATGIMRTGFCVTDGLEWLRVRAAPRSARTLEASAREYAAEFNQDVGPMALTHCASTDDGRLQVVLDGLDPIKGMRVVGLWFTGPAGAVYMAEVITTAITPPDRRFPELVDVVDSVEWHASTPAPPRKRRWWLFGG